MLIAQLANGDDVAAAREARTQAKWRASTYPDVRMALAEHYRRLGDPAQAGRWGIVFPGWTRQHEVARLRLFLLSNADDNDFVRRYLCLRRKSPVPAELTDLVAPQFIRRGPRGHGRVFLLGCLGVLAGAVAALFLVVAMAEVLWNGLVERPYRVHPWSLVPAVAVTVVGLLFATWMTKSPSPRARIPGREFAIRRAQELLEERPTEGRAMLQGLVRTTADPRVRRTLVDDARRRRRLADAGRWGCTEAGLTTPEERNAYANFLCRKATKDLYSRLMDLSAAWGESTAPGDCADVLQRVGVSPPSGLLPPVVAFPPRVRWWFIPLLALPSGALGAMSFPTQAHPISVGAVAIVAAAWGAVCVASASVVARPGDHRMAYAACAVILFASAVALGIAAT